MICRGVGANEAAVYKLSETEREIVLEKMDEYCQEREGLTLDEYCEKIQTEVQSRVSYAGTVARVCPREALCALLRRLAGAWIPRQENARRLGAFSRHFRPGAPVRKWHYDKGRYTQGRTSRPQSPATRVFFSLRARYTFSRNSKFQVNAEPRNTLASRASAVLRA